MDACQTLAEYATKYVAHAATPESRDLAKVDEANITLGHLWDAQRIIYQVAQFLAGYLLFDGDHAPLVLETPSLFEHWDIPLITTNSLPRLEERWKAYNNETEHWRLQGVSQMARQIFPISE